MLLSVHGEMGVSWREHARRRCKGHARAGVESCRQVDFLGASSLWVGVWPLAQVVHRRAVAGGGRDSALGPPGQMTCLLGLLCCNMGMTVLAPVPLRVGGGFQNVQAQSRA